MSNLKILLKNEFNILIGRIQGKKKRMSTNTAIVLLILGMIGLLVLYSLQSWGMFEGLGKMGLGKLCVFHGVITTLTVVLIIGIMRVTGKTKSNDSDFLLSLPIKKRDIIIAKLFSKYLFDLFFAFVLLAPFIVMYEITAPIFSASILIFGFVVIIFLPLLSVGISQIMDYIVVKLFNRMKFGTVLKSLIPTLLLILLMVLLTIKTSGYGNVEYASMEEYFKDRWLSNQILTFIFDQTLVSILTFVGIILIPITIGIILNVNIYGKNFGVYVNTNRNIKLKKAQAPFRHLFKKELKLYFTTPAYLVNTIIGPIGIVAISIFLVISGTDSLQKLLQVSIPSSDLVYFIALVINLLIANTCISSVSISLESKNFWFLRSLPLATSQIFISKLLVPLIVVLPTTLIASALVGIMLHSVTLALLVFGVTSLYLILTDILGLIINLWHPKLNWENEVQVVKQSLSVLLSMVFNFVIAVIPIAIALIFEISITLTALITIGLYVLLLICFTILLFTRGQRLFRNLEA